MLIGVNTKRMAPCQLQRLSSAPGDRHISPYTERHVKEYADNVQLDARGAELLFQILTEREERSSVATGTNLPFSEWGKVVPDQRLVAAIIDRLTFHAHIIETGSDSYRLRATKAKRSR